MKTRNHCAWINGALTAFLIGTLIVGARSCTECKECPDVKCNDCPENTCNACPENICNDCPDVKCGDCPDNGHNCGDCVTYLDLFALQKEAETNMDAIYIAEISYFCTNNTYTPSFPEMNWLPQPGYRYAYFLPGEVIQPQITAPYQLPAGLTPGVNGYSFTAVAVGNIDCDAVLDVWTVNDARIIKNLVNDVLE